MIVIKMTAKEIKECILVPLGILVICVLEITAAIASFKLWVISTIVVIVMLLVIRLQMNFKDKENKDGSKKDS